MMSSQKISTAVGLTFLPGQPIKENKNHQPSPTDIVVADLDPKISIFTCNG